MNLQVIPAFCLRIYIHKELKKTWSFNEIHLPFGFLVAVAIAGLSEVDGAGECGKSSPDMEAFKLAPCASAAQDERLRFLASCCAQVKKLGQNPKCLCAVMLSNTAKSSGIKPEIAMTIPKRCNIADRPVGYQCGDTFADDIRWWNVVLDSKLAIFRASWLKEDTMLLHLMAHKCQPLFYIPLHYY
ncbi:hypothetical protein OSB04_028288 [Centaurea solstitialis]|uniref:Bifunctional inhibitor/plant lipid transfer protein/seed storage helical domain-containing protein n=1 Tax=Centaurea solstitialis TaxID=347529 RepID=A0AA38SYZ3_9ASTR|nr:hypothetical protein OSB04_028288 [Centaurea solstitialis]